MNASAQWSTLTPLPIIPAFSPVSEDNGNPVEKLNSVIRRLYELHGITMKGLDDDTVEEKENTIDDQGKGKDRQSVSLCTTTTTPTTTGTIAAAPQESCIPLQSSAMEAALPTAPTVQPPAASVPTSPRTCAALLQQSSHAPVRLHACKVCGKLFKTSSTLKQHLAAHARGTLKIHLCEICGKRCRGHNMTRHLQSHVTKTLDNCDTCKRGFRWPHRLKHHLQRYHPTEPSSHYYCRCSLCPLAFVSTGAAETHMENVHRHNKYKIVSMAA